MNHCLTNVRMVTFLIRNGLIQVHKPFTCYESFDQNACMHACMLRSAFCSIVMIANFPFSTCTLFFKDVLEMLTVGVQRMYWFLGLGLLGGGGWGC